jgi:hypothetical protein
MTAPAGRALTLDERPRLVLRHPVFATFEHPFFRLADSDRKPVLVVRMDELEASLPLSGLMREFGISAVEEDGLMLALVPRALAFVSALRIGDPLPPEILTGSASWMPTTAAQDSAIGRLTRNLLTWAGTEQLPNARETLYRAGQLVLSADDLAAILQHLAERIGGTSPAETLNRIQRVAGEFAHIDALRTQLLHGAERLGTVLNRTARTFQGDHTHKELLMQVKRLAMIGIADLRRRFEQADLIVKDIAALADQPDATIDRVRTARDELYVRWRAWEPYCLQWDTIEPGHHARVWHLAYDTYRFLAPRFMTTVEWLSTAEAGPTQTVQRTGMVW